MAQADTAEAAPVFGAERDRRQIVLRSFATRPEAVKTLPEQLAEKLVEEIILGTYAPGQRLQEIALAEKFSVSRGPVREALRILEREGLVVMLPRRGASVVRLTAKRVRDIFDVRAVLMARCTEELARTRDPAILAGLAAGTASLEEAIARGKQDEFIILVYQLSMYVYEAAQNDLARDILISLARQTLSLTGRAMAWPEYRESWANNWKAIVAAINAGDPERAREATECLVETVRDVVLNALVSLDGGGEDAPSTGDS